jgi:hypothetical protein
MAVATMGQSMQREAGLRKARRAAISDAPFVKDEG